MFGFERKQILIAGGAVVLMVGVLLAVLVPLNKKLKNLQAQHQSLLQQNQMAAAKAQSYPQLAEKLERMQQEVGDFDAKIPAERAVGAFLQQIADIMKRHNLANQLVQPSAEVQADKLNCIPVSFACTGNLEQIFAFFQDIEKLQRLIHIEQLELDADDKADSAIRLSAKANIYYRAI